MTTPAEETHAIVNFVQEASVAVAPKGWINKKGNKCWWPGTNAEKMAKKSKPRSKDWPSYECKVIRWFSSYSEAALKLNDATYTSDLSDNDKRKMKGPVLPAVTLPTAPGLSSGMRSLQSSPSAVNLRESSSSSSPKLPSSLESRHQIALANLIDGGSTDDNNMYDAGASAANESQLFPLADVNCVLTEDGTPAKLPCSMECQDFRKDILLKLETIEQSMNSQKELIMVILDRVSELTNEKTVDSTYSFPPGHFPLKDIPDVDALNTLITTNEAAYNKLVSVLKTSGGGTVDEAVKLMMKTLMIDDVLARYCFRGQSEKRTFCSYDAILNAMLDALSNNILTKGSATKENLGKSIPKAHKQAADRISQRRKNVIRGTVGSTQA